MSTGYAACYIRTIFPNQLNPSNFVSSADCFVTACMMETAAVVDGILNWKWKLEHENLTNLAELLSHLVAFLSSEAFDIKKQHRMINYLPNGFGKQNVNSTCIHTYSYRAISHSGKDSFTSSSKITWEMLLKGRLTETEKVFFFTILSNADAGFHLGKVVSL